MDVNIFNEAKSYRTHYSFGTSEREHYIRVDLIRGQHIRQQAVGVTFSDYRILLLLKGEGSYSEPENSDQVPLMVGSLIQRCPGVTHSLYRSKSHEWLELALVISHDLYKNIQQLEILPKETVLKFSHISEATLDDIKVFMSLLRKYQQEDESTLAIGETVNFLARIFRNASYKEEDELVRQINKACELMIQNLNQPVYMQDIAEKIGLGYHNFRKQFKAIKGISPKEFLLRRRIDHAVELIAQTSDTLSEIAYQVGYPDLAAFSKAFKKRIGVSPGAFRNQ